VEDSIFEAYWWLEELHKDKFLTKNLVDFLKNYESDFIPMDPEDDYFWLLKYLSMPLNMTPQPDEPARSFARRIAAELEKRYLLNGFRKALVKHEELKKCPK
jgi:hypothetical protein